jgi:hypothetical protein
VRVGVSRARDAFASTCFADADDADAPPPPSSSFVAADLVTMAEDEALEAAARDRDDEGGVVAVGE